MLTTTRSLARFLRGEGPAHPSGHPTLTATTLPLQPMARKRRRFWYTHPRFERFEFSLRVFLRESRTTKRSNNETDNLHSTRHLTIAAVLILALGVSRSLLARPEAAGSG